MDILSKIKKLKDERGWSVYKLADEAGITQSTLANMFARGTQPSIATLSSLCNAFGISLSEFFAEEKTTKSDHTSEFTAKFNKLSEKSKKIVLSLLDELK